MSDAEILVIANRLAKGFAFAEGGVMLIKGLAESIGYDAFKPELIRIAFVKAARAQGLDVTATALEVCAWFIYKGTRYDDKVILKCTDSEAAKAIATKFKNMLFVEDRRPVKSELSISRVAAAFPELTAKCIAIASSTGKTRMTKKGDLPVYFCFPQAASIVPDDLWGDFVNWHNSYSENLVSRKTDFGARKVDTKIKTSKEVIDNSRNNSEYSDVEKMTLWAALERMMAGDNNAKPLKAEKEKTLKIGN